MEEKCTHTVIEGTKNALFLSVLLRCIWTCETQKGAIRVEESTVGGVVELTSIVGPENFNGTRKLCANVSIELREELVNFGFLTNRKSPYEMREIVKNNKVILATRNT